MKVIDGVEYNNEEEYKSRFMCWVETCDLAWEKAKWVDTKKK